VQEVANQKCKHQRGRSKNQHATSFMQDLFRCFMNFRSIILTGLSAKATGASHVTVANVPRIHLCNQNIPQVSPDW
jgi:hypothetical protein